MEERRKNNKTKKREKRRISLITIIWIVFFVFLICIILWIVTILNKNALQNETKKIDSTIPIPDGFYFVGGTKDTGFIISDSKHDYKKGTSYDVLKDLEGNQFVWVPVENPIANSIDDVNNMVKENKYPIAYKDGENYKGILYNFNIKTKTYTPMLSDQKYKEPIILDDPIYGDLDELLENSRGDLYQKSFNNMIQSVIKNSGFYISRYEVGELYIKDDENKKVVSKYNQTNISNDSWFNMYKKIKEMYDREDISTEIIWGCQWDATARWILKNDKNAIDIANNDYKKGNFANYKIPTGSNKEYCFNNIYDMLGNVSEWTQTGADTGLRLTRGGDYTKKTSIIDINSMSPSYLTEDIGTRMVMYIN